MSLRRGIAANGDSVDVGTWSGIPHYLLRAAQRSGFLKAGLNLEVPGATWKRRAWHAGRLIRGERPRGFQYSAEFLGALGKQAVQECERHELQEVVSHYQLLSAKELAFHGITTSFYIDTTLDDLFSTHGMRSWLNLKVAGKAIAMEAEGYRAAARVISMARWVQKPLQEVYGVAPDKIFTVLPGANLPDDKVTAFFRTNGRVPSVEGFSAERPLRIGFTGKDWKRKGLARLVGAVETLQKLGIHASVVVIGNMPEEYKAHPQVQAAGFIDKNIDVDRFMQTLLSCDVGCAPSHEEPMGIAPLEYLRLGIPVLCTAAGGLVDVCEAAGDAAILLAKDANAEEIALRLEHFAKDNDLRQEMRDTAWERKEYFRWERTVADLEDIWLGTHASAKRAG